MRHSTSIVKTLALTYLLACMINWPTLAHAATIQVDALPNQLSGCDILDAIRSANTDTAIGGCIAGSGDDEILLAGTHFIQFEFNSGNPPTEIDTAALPDISSNITITGTNPNERARIIRSALNDNQFRIMNILSGNVVLNNISLRNGLIADRELTSDLENRGAGIFVVSGSLVLNKSELRFNRAGTSGGGIHAAAASKIEIIDSELTSNTAGTASAFSLAQVDTRILIEGTTFAQNNVSNSIGSTLRITNSDMTIKRSAIVNNDGSGIQVTRGGLSILDSTVSDNASTPDDSFFNANVFGISLVPTVASSLSILNSTIVNNPPPENDIGETINAHGIRIFPPLRNTTQSLSVNLRNNIISANGGAGIQRSKSGTEIEVVDSDSNRDPSDITFTILNNVLGFSGVTSIEAFNNVPFNVAENQLVTSNSVNPKALSRIVNPLDDYGGPTLSHTLVPGSPAINNATEGAFTSSGGLFFFEPGCRGEIVSFVGVPPFRDDQRGFARPVGGQCDIGATELRPEDLPEQTCYPIKARNQKIVVFCL